MGTANFLNYDASKTFIIANNDDEFFHDDIVDNMKYELKDAFKADYSHDGECYNDSNRNFPATKIGEVFFEKSFGIEDISFYIKIDILLVSGYYKSANLDYVVNFFCENDYYEDGETVSESEKYIEDCLSYFDTKLKASTIKTWGEVQTRKATKKIEKIFKSYSDAYNVCARFSSGETIYCRA